MKVRQRLSGTDYNMMTKKQIFLSANGLALVLIVLTIYLDYHVMSTSAAFCNVGQYSFWSRLLTIFGYRPERYLIYVCDQGKSCGEWPRRLDGIILAYVISVLTDRKLGVIVTKPDPLQTLFEPAKISWIVDPETLIFGSCNYYNFMFDKNFSTDLETKDLDVLLPEDAIYIKLNEFDWYSLYENPRYRGRLQTYWYTPANTYHQAFTELFQPQANFRYDIMKYSNKFKPHLATNLVCGIIEESNTGANRLQGLWSFFDKFANVNDTFILVSSEDNDITEKAKSRYKDQFRTVPGNLGHIDWTGDTVTLGANWRQNLLDFYTLILCDHLVVNCGEDLGRVVAFARNSDEGLYYYEENQVWSVHLDTMSRDHMESTCTVNEQRPTAAEKAQPAKQ